MRTALFEFLEGVIPLDTDDMALWIKVQKNDNADGYQLIYKIFQLYMPGFNRTIILDHPLYHATDTVAGFAGAILSHFRIKAKTGDRTTQKTMSLLFLQNIAHPNVTNSIPIWIERVNNHVSSDEFGDDGSLPYDLQIPSLALDLSKMVKATAKAMETNATTGRRVNGLIMNDDMDTRLAHVESYLTNLSTQATSPPIVCHIQGFTAAHEDYEATINALHNTRDKKAPWKNNDRTKSDDWKKKGPKKRKPVDLSIICEACKSAGHAAADCFLLARAIWVLKYIRSNKPLTDMIANKWEDRHKGLANVKMAAAFCEENNMTVDQVASELSYTLDDVLDDELLEDSE